MISQDCRRILVTGGSGFVGQQVIRALCAENVEIAALGRRPDAQTVSPGVTWLHWDALDNSESVDITPLAADTLILVAWDVEHGKYWAAPENQQWIDANQRVADAFLAAGGTRIVGIGTCAEYDLLSGNGPLNETTSPIGPTSLYGRAKDASRRMLDELCNSNNVDFAWARLFHLYGPGEDRRRLVPSIVLNLLNDTPANCSSGLQRRDFMHVADAGHAIAALALSPVVGAVNVASGAPTTVGHVAQELGRLLEKPSLIRLGALQDRVDDPPSILADVARLQEEVGFRPRISLADGLSETSKWWQQKLQPDR